LPASPHTPANDLLDTADALLTPAEVARLFRVDPKTVARWEKDGRLASVRTLGGHRRYPKPQLDALLSTDADDSAILRALEDAHTAALDTGALPAAARITALIDELRAP